MQTLVINPPTMKLLPTSGTRATVWLGLVLLFFPACRARLISGDDQDSIRVHSYRSGSYINIHYVTVAGKVLLFDSGNVGNAREIEQHFRREGLDLAAVDYLVITHGHADYAGNAHYFQEEYGMKIIVGSAEADLIAASGEDESLCPRGFNGWLVNRTIGGRVYEPFVPDIQVDSILDLSTIGLAGKIVEVPGHTPGSIVTFLGDKAFVGDLIRGKVFNHDRPDYHIFMCDLEDNRQDIITVATQSGIQQWYLGHLGPLSIEAVNTFIAQETNE